MTRTALNESVADAIISRGVGKRPPFTVCENVTWGQLYFGGEGYKAPKPISVKDPPSVGWSTVFVMDDGDPHFVKVFHLWTMRSWQVLRHGHEMSSYQGVGYETEFPKARFEKSLPQYYAEHRRRADPTADYDTAIALMMVLGVETPSADRLGDFPPMEQTAAATHAPKPPKEKGDGSTFKKVKKDGRRGEVLAFFLDGGTSAAAAIGKFGITRSNLLSQLYLLNKDHGIGYTVKGDAVSVSLPEGIEDPFA
jgi:hypothetical protein